jgi:hypothetical protein
MDTGVVFWLTVVAALAAAVALGLALANLPRHGGEDDFRSA